MPPKIDREVFQEVRDELKSLPIELQELKEDCATYKGAMRVFNWFAFTVLPALGGLLGFLGIKIGIGASH